MLQILNKNKLGFVKFWKIIPVFAQGKGLNLTHKNFELYGWQCSSYCIYGVAGRLLEKKKKKKKKVC